MTKLAEKLREAVEEEIATGRLQPGAHLDEAQLAARFGMSRTPVREALNLLAGEGLIERRPRRGAVVMSIGPTRLMEMFEVMGELEAMCGRLAARRIKGMERTELVAAHEACGLALADGDSDRYYYCNERFHAAIYAGGQNKFLQEQALLLHRRLRPYRRLQLRVRNRMQTSFKEHTAVVHAILSGEPDAAALALRQHVTVQGERFGDLLASMAEMASAA